ncbi:hypothetical protein PoB_000095000 [Plakobranchus ocellatus]|uniref:Secreted protein n=1 Tax=Plakobranchus ocellatus TaxID=259542 RepID=A0AAV3XUY3_9GAST|nr:hypothetical protein PoB_000095000 [Plakobranchus ocellatus]
MATIWKIKVLTASMAVLLVTTPDHDPPGITWGPKPAPKDRGGEEPRFVPNTKNQHPTVLTALQSDE